MTRRTLSFTALALVITLLAACGVHERLTQVSEHDKGAAAAEKDIAAGTPHYYSGFGLPPMDRPGIDQKTGLPAWGLGCVIDDARGEFADGYNEAMVAAFEAGRLDGMTLGHKWMEQDEIATVFVAAGPETLAYDGETRVEAPGGRFVIDLAPRFGKPGDTPYLFVTDSETGKRTELYFLGEEKCRVAFAHEGTTLILRDDHNKWFKSYDLPRPLDIQTFIDPDRGW